jgi:GTPase SAR1 family protein
VWALPLAPSIRPPLTPHPGRVLSSQTIGVEFASKIVKIGSGARRRRIKLQCWDTAGTERFRSVSRSYYRGAAGAILVYDVTSRASFRALPTFLADARALASPQLTLLLAGNKADIAEAAATTDSPADPPTPSGASVDSRRSGIIPPRSSHGSLRGTGGSGLGSQNTATAAAEGREVPAEEASQWASKQGIPVAVEVSALTGENVEEVFGRLARTILTRIELGEINPDDPASGIQYGDTGLWEDGGSIKSGITLDDGFAGVRRRRRRGGTNSWMGGTQEWEDVFRVGRGRRGCCWTESKVWWERVVTVSCWSLERMVWCYEAKAPRRSYIPRYYTYGWLWVVRV